MMRLEIDGWAQGLKFSASHLIPGHEKCSRLHGHTYAVSAIIEGGQGRGGIVIDFIEVKDAVRKICDQLDHRVLLPRKSDLMDVVEKKKNVVVKTGGKRYQFPLEDVAFIDVKVPSAEEIAKYVLKRLIKEIKFPPGVTAVEICVEEGKGQGAWAREIL
jgi:6-pyruvoyltetrahydropterin/6-carboxytetrahydropterin synthase